MTSNPDFTQGYYAGHQALDRTPSDAHDMLAQVQTQEQIHREQGRPHRVDWCQGYATAIREFLQEKGT